MQVVIRRMEARDLEDVRALWNDIVAQGASFPGREPLSPAEARAFFAAQTYVGVAVADGAFAGFYILHPNNIGRCAHVANASYGVDAHLRGQGIGRALVNHSIDMLAPCGFRGLQFNAVVSTNAGAIKLYEELGFTRVGVIPGGYDQKDVGYVDTYIYYHPAREA
nr:N-acetyltransferase [Maliibacterium massiliense]